MWQPIEHSGEEVVVNPLKNDFYMTGRVTELRRTDVHQYSTRATHSTRMKLSLVLHLLSRLQVPTVAMMLLLQVATVVVCPNSSAKVGGYRATPDQFISTH